ncbi:hypothetical protein ACFX1T_034781 [Malus domestica]
MLDRQVSLPHYLLEPRELANTNVFQVHPVVSYNVVDADFHKSFLVLLVIAVKGEVPNMFYKIHQIFPVFLACIVELSCRDPFLMLEVCFYRTCLPTLPRSRWNLVGGWCTKYRHD